MTNERNAGRYHNRKTGKTSFHNTEEFKYLGPTPAFKTAFKKKLEDD